MITLRKFTAENMNQIVALEVAPHQRGFVSGNLRSLAEAYVAIANGGVALPFGIYADDTPIGFVMFSYGAEDWPDAPAIAHDNYSIWRLMIDHRHQGRGYGRAAMTEALRYLRTFPCGRAAYCWLSYEPENEAARKLYRSLGFAETSEYDGNECIAVLRL